ncbi:uncharacterized protein LOC134535458 [Bacillus rossius redtenbacheri]|uniref:uncharacterized protein LOC134535458 n=1 Tax=Bacillus rossius redtenbacheri TaxID=93214 RepID=UPI002FDDCF11
MRMTHWNAKFPESQQLASCKHALEHCPVYCQASKMAKWSGKDIITLLELYESQECLWNTQSESYKNRGAREKAIKYMVENTPVAATEQDIKNKIKALRSTYSQEVGKIRASKKSVAGLEDVYKPQLVWFSKADSFLRQVVTLRTTSSSMATNTQTADEMTQDSDEEGLGRQHNISDVATSITNSNRSGGPSRPQGRGQKRKTPSSVTAVSTALQDLRKITDDINKEEDEFDCFGKLVACNLKKLPLQSALNCQLELQHVLMKHRMLAATERQTTMPNTSSLVQQQVLPIQVAIILTFCSKL